MQKVKDDVEIRELGMKSLINTLGYAGMIRFLRQFSKGSGDYLELHLCYNFGYSQILLS